MEERHDPAGGERPAPAPGDAGSRLDVLRAWLGTLDRMVAIRTRIGLVLVALCVGASAAAVYLALEGRGSDEAELSRLRTEVEMLRAEVDALKSPTGGGGAARAAGDGNPPGASTASSGGSSKAAAEGQAKSAAGTGGASP